MGNTASSSTGTPSQLVRDPTTKPKCKPVFTSNRSLSDIREIIIWRSQPALIHQEAEIPWTVSHITSVLHYVLKLEGISVSQFNAQRYIDEAWDPKREPIHKKRMTKMFVSFTHDLRKFFEVPKLHELSSHNNKNEILAAFIDFLLQLLYDRTASMVSFEEQIDCLKKELSFLLTVLGDTSLNNGVNVEQLQINLVSELETVAIHAGSLVHSLVFLSDRIFKSIRINKELDALFKRIHLLKFNISKFSNMLPLFSNAKTVSVDSLFILDSLLYNINDLKNQELNETVTRIKDVAYEAEYLVNSILVGDVPLWYLTTRLTHVINQIKHFGTVLQEIKQNYDIGALKVAEEFIVEQIPSQDKNNSEVDDVIVGFEDTTTDILDQLVGGTEQLQIISIFGMPGLGKTTFTKKLYNHPLVDYRFDKRFWCVASQTYQMKIVLADIMISSKSEANKHKILEMEEQNIVEQIYKSLKGRRYLIVIDDIWSSNVWDDLRRSFPDDGNGSRILFTSRHKDVAPPNSIINTLPFLSNDQCWELLEKKVFHNKPCPPKLIRIGKEIAANCWGLPLAVVVIAGILSDRDMEESTWKNVGERLASFIFSEQNNPMTHILQLSYKHLPKYLKPCFLYFGAFPEDAEISARKLMRLWIAEGFVREEETKSAESVAEEYLMELITKSLVMVAKRRWDGGVKACVIHDLLRDLCLKISEQANFVKLVDGNCSIYQKGHHLLSLQSPLTPFFGSATMFALFMPNVMDQSFILAA